MMLELSSSNGSYIVLFLNNCPLICDRIFLLGHEVDPKYMRFTNCKIEHKIESTIQSEKRLSWNITANDKSIDKIKVYSHHCSKCISSFALEVTEYILEKSDFIKARTFNEKLALTLNADWAQRNEETAIQLANKRQEALNKETAQENIDLLKRLIHEIRNLFFLGSGWLNMSSKLRQKILKKNKNVLLPEKIVKKLTESLTEEFPDLVEYLELNAEALQGIAKA